MAVGSMWKADNKFVIQFNQVKPREKSFIFKSLKEWNESGSGFHKDGTEVLIFSNTLFDEEKVYSLVKSMPFPFTEESRNGNSKKIKTQYNCKVKEKGLTDSRSHGKIGGGRTCSKCGFKGHNSRTCKK